MPTSRAPRRVVLTPIIFPGPSSHPFFLAPADEEGIRRHSIAMNAGSAVPLFAGMLTQRPWEEITKKEVRRHPCCIVHMYRTACTALHRCSASSPSLSLLPVTTPACFCFQPCPPAGVPGQPTRLGALQYWHQHWWLVMLFGCSSAAPTLSPLSTFLPASVCRQAQAQVHRRGAGAHPGLCLPVRPGNRRPAAPHAPPAAAAAQDKRLPQVGWWLWRWWCEVVVVVVRRGV